MEQIEIEDRGPVRIVRLHRPDKLNAWTPRMHAELFAAITAGNDDGSVGAFVVTGSGRGFCAGADIGEVFAARAEGAVDADGRRADEARGDWVALIRSSKPVVAAINGAAIGVGLTLTLPMDFLVAAPEAKLSVRFVKMGLVPELASSHFLVQRCGWGRASDLSLSGRTVLGDEALQIGLVDEIADDVVAAAIERAQTYATNAPPSLRLTKRLLTQNSSETDLALVQRREIEALHEAYETSEHREAIAAFAEKREPSFR
ncbi:enoyl-CoA hydratase/isomerase family protein [Ilumatobacter sp.]|uniref:enoyl-CoA hydratase/isomerase family protein n=1 Tax=Ilumatobacter sp. TaxID=1967498 RepID=UPI003B52AA83